MNVLWGSSVWNPEKPRAMIWVALSAAGRDGLAFAALAEGVPGIARPQLSLALSQLKSAGFLTLQGKRPGQWRINPEHPGPTMAKPRPEAGTAAHGAMGEVAAGAGKILCDRPQGADSGYLATTLGCTSNEVEYALAPAVADHQLVCCATVRDGHPLVFYRLAALGVRGYDWRTQGEATWGNRLGQQARVAERAAHQGHAS